MKKNLSSISTTCFASIFLFLVCFNTATAQTSKGNPVSGKSINNQSLWKKNIGQKKDNTPIVITNNQKQIVNTNKEGQKTLDAKPVNASVGINKVNKAASKEELISLRDAHSKTFQNPDGSLTKQQSNKPIHFKNNKDEWSAIDGKLQISNENNKIYEIANTELPVSIDMETGKTNMYLVKGSYVSFGHETELIVLDKQLNQTRKISAKNTNDNLQGLYSKNNNEIRFNNVWNTIDKKQKFDYWFTEIDYILNTKPTFSATEKYLVFKEKVDMPKSWQLVKSETGTETTNGWQGDLEIKNENGIVVGRFHLPVYYDMIANANNNEPSVAEKKNNKQISINASTANRGAILGAYRLEKTDNAYYLSVVVPTEWLLADERIYPVTIDPTASNTYASGNIASCYYNSFFTQTMNVEIPAGSTVTATSSSCTYVAVSPTWQSEGWIGFQSGSNLDGYWYCNVTSPGTCQVTGDDPTIANGTYSNGIVPFTLKVARDYPSGTCNTTYLYVQNSTWTETVTYTLPCIVPGVAALTFPANYATVQPGKTIHFTWDAPTTGNTPFTYTFYFYNGSSWQNWSAGSNTYFVLNLNEYGSNSWCGITTQWYVKATNTCGNTNSATRNLYVYPKHAGANVDYTLTIESECQTTGSRALTQGQAHYYSFEAVAGNKYFFSTCANELGCGSNTGWDTYLKIYGTNSSCTMASYNDDGGSCSNYESFINEWTCTTSGTYYLQVTGYNSSAYGTYSLQYKHCATPTALSSTSPANNAYAQPGKFVHFTWETPTGTGPFTYTFYVWNGSSWLNYECDTNKYIDIDFEEYNSASWCGDNAQWYVKATNACGQVNSETRNLYLYPKYSGSTADYEITPSSECQATATHSIIQGGANYYKFDAVAGAMYYFSTCANALGCGTNAGWDTYLKIYGADGTCTTVAYNDDGGGCSNYESYINGWTCTTSGTYYLQVTGYNSSAYGSYHVIYKADFPVANFYFRSKQNGNLNSYMTWEFSLDNINWFDAGFAPTYHNRNITVQENHTVTFNSTDTLDQLTINGTFVYSDFPGSYLIINNENGVDLFVNGTFEEYNPNGITWLNSATWEMGNNGTLIRTRSTSENNWRDKYNNGISNIPSTANWIVRKIGSDSPYISSTNGMYYPNLTIENYSESEWTTEIYSSFAGSSDFPRIKGSLDIGGNGTNTVSFLNENTNSTPVLVQGNLTIKSGSALRNYGTGFEIQGNFTVNGTINYDSDDGRKLVFSGINSQSISGSGTLNIYALEVNKSSNSVSLGREIIVDNALTLTSGKIILDTNDITIAASATISGESSSGYIVTNSTGKIVKKYSSTGTAFTFPTGDVSNYTPFTVTLNSATLGTNAEINGRTVNSAAPYLASVNHYINRHWIINESDIIGLNANISYTYAQNDVIGNEDSYSTMIWDTIMGSSKIGVVNTSTNMATSLSLNNLGYFSVFEYVEYPIEVVDSIRSLPDSLVYAFDRFGNEFTMEEMQRPESKQTYSICGHGNLYFDVTYSSNYLNNTLAGSMSTVLCQVLTDISYLVQPPAPVTVYLKVGDQNDGPTLPATALAGASEYFTVNYPLPSTGIIFGNVWNAINTGINNPLPQFDGWIRVNFNLSAGHNWFTGLNSFPGSTNDYDAYSVLLHEVYHLLGFYSLMGPHGQSICSVSQQYSKYDTFLKSNLPGYSGYLLSHNGCYNDTISLNDTVITAGCQNMVYDGLSSINHQPVYTSYPYLFGTTLSHFDNTCYFANTNFLMHPFLGGGHHHRFPLMDEVRVLCDIGYNVTGIFGDGTHPSYNFNYPELACSNQNVAGVDDSIFVIQNCDTLTLTPLTNDINAASFTCMQIMSGSGTLSTSFGTSSIFIPSPGYTGFVNIAYIPVSLNNSRGNITNIKIFVSPCGESSCSYPVPCNLICNGDFQHILDSVPGQLGTLAQISNGYVPSWQQILGTPDCFPNGLNYGYANMWAANTYVYSGGFVYYSEAIYTFVNVQAHKKYIFSYYRRTSPHPDITGQITNVLDYADVYLTNPALLYSTIMPFKILEEQNLPLDTNWKHVVVCFQPDADYPILAIMPRQMSTDSRPINFHVDRLELIEDTFTIDYPLVQGCRVQYTPSICSVDSITYQWCANGVPLTGQTNPLSLIQTGVSSTTIFDLRRHFPPNPSTVVIPPVNPCCTDSITIDTVVVSNPLTATLYSNGSNCQNIGSVTVVPSGGLAPYQYEWYIDTVYPPVVITTQTVTNLEPGMYTVHVVDASACTFIDSVQVSDTVLNITKTDIGCDLGTATVTTPNCLISPFSFSWSNGATTSNISNLTSGTYTVTVTDATSATVTASVTIGVDPLVYYNPPPITTIPVNTTENWDTPVEDYTINTQIIVNYGATLTITNRHIQFGPQGSIAVRRTGRLIIENSTLSGLDECNNMWKGIEAYGVFNPAYGAEFQIVNANEDGFNTALVGVIDESVIKDAIIGIHASNSAVTIVVNSSFLNNVTAFKFSGSKGLPNPESKDASTFYNVTFETNSLLNDPDQFPQQFVYLTGIEKHLFFNNCKFNHTFPLVSGHGNTYYAENLGSGIVSINSHLNVLTMDSDSSCFSGLFYGIRSLSENAGSTLNIDKAKFLNNFRSILVENTGVVNITKSRFNLSYFGMQPLLNLSFPPPYSTANYGIYLNSSQTNTIKENFIYNGEFGLIMNNCLIEYVIYKNTFRNISSAAITGIGKNHGTKLTCNIFGENDLGNNIDIFTPNFQLTPFSPINNSYINQLQGTPTSSAKNVFNTNYCFAPCSTAKAFNSASNNYIYYYHAPDDITDFNEDHTSNVFTQSTSQGAFIYDDECPQSPDQTISISGGIPRLDSLAEKITDSTSVYNQLVDGGSTANLLSMVENVTEQTYNSLCNTLEGIAPFLSDTVLLAFMADTVYSPLPKAGVLFACSPLPAKPAAEIQNLNLSQYLIDSLLAVQNGVNARVKKEHWISHLEWERGLLLGQIIQDALLDSVTDKTDSLIYLLQNEQNYTAKMQVLPMLVAKERYAEAMAVLNALQTEIPNLPESIQDELYHYVTLQGIVIEVAQAPDSLKNNIIAQDSLFLKTLAETSELATVDAQVMLWKAGIANYLGVIQYPETGGNEKSSNNGKNTTNTKNKLKLPDVISVYPNPAKDFVSIKYSLFGTSANDKLCIYTMDGKLLREISINKQSGTETIDVKNFANGSYIVRFGNKSYKKIFTVIH